MKKNSAKCFQLLFLALLMACAFVGVQQARANDNPLPVCMGYSCSTGDDCGSSCFCNQARGMCWAPTGPQLPGTR